MAFSSVSMKFLSVLHLRALPKSFANQSSISFRSLPMKFSHMKSLAIRAVSVPAAPASEGIAPAISLTDNALKHLNKMRSERNEDLCLRIGVRQGGCSGMSYAMEFENRANARPDDSIIEYNGFVIGCCPEGGMVGRDLESSRYVFLEVSGSKNTSELNCKIHSCLPDSGLVTGAGALVCDPKSLLFLFGMQLDYSDALIGGGFSFKNPNATQTCGCGKSFAAEM